MADDIVTRLRSEASANRHRGTPLGFAAMDAANGIEARDAEIKGLRAENEAIRVANHEAMWNDTLIPIANALGLTVYDEHGVLRRQFQMVEAIIKEARRG